MSGKLEHVPRWTARLRTAIRPALAVAAAAALLSTAAIGVGLWRGGYGALPRTGIALAVLSLPPAIVAGLAALAIDTLLPRLGPLSRTAAMLILLAALGPLASAGVFSLHYRATYPVGFQPIWTEVGFHQLAWTGIATIYMFGVIGLRLFLPFAPFAAAILSILYGWRLLPALRRTGASATDPASSDNRAEERR